MTSERLVLTDDAWEAIAKILEELKSKAGRPPEQSDRMFIEAVLSVARTGIPWRDLPEDFGKWDAVYNRFRRWEARGLGKKLWASLQVDDLKIARNIFIDSTIVRAHQQAAGALKKRWASRPSFGTFSWGIFHENPCRLYRGKDRRVDGAHRRRTE